MSEFETKKDCFGYCKETNGCSALDKLYCKTEKCGFYKTKEQYKADMKKYGHVVE